MSFSQALRYPFQGKDWFRRIFILALVQCIPIVGQLILIGYGLDVVRSVYAGQTDLPPVRWWAALADGARFLIAGIIYVLPLLMAVPVIFTVGTTQVNSSTGGKNFSGICMLLPIALALVVFPIVSQLRKRKTKVATMIARILSATPILAIALALWSLITSGVDLTTGGRDLNGIGIFLIIALALVVFLIVIGLHVSSARYAIETRGLFDATLNVRLLLKNRPLTGKLILNFILLILFTVTATGFGLVLLILPGLFMFVVCVVAWWYLLARFAVEVVNKK
jgi:hypothetical protein